MAFTCCQPTAPAILRILRIHHRIGVPVLEVSTFRYVGVQLCLDLSAMNLPAPMNGSGFRAPSRRPVTPACLHGRALGGRRNPFRGRRPLLHSQIQGLLKPSQQVVDPTCDDNGDCEGGDADYT
jgi:hypothetical protein